MTGPSKKGRLMSVAFTQEQVRARSKTVTRRKGWKFLLPGDRLVLCPQVQGLAAGEKVQRLAIVEVVHVRREPLSALLTDPAYAEREMHAEGFPGWDAQRFINAFFVRQGMNNDSEVTRIEWRYIDEEKGRN